MTPSHTRRSLETLIAARQPVFLWGPPGVGKSDLVAQTAASLGLDLIDIRAVLLDPVDLRGLPQITPDGLTSWRPPAFLPREGSGLLFLDELNAAPPLVQAACYQLILDRRLGEYVLPDGWTVMAAGNREQDRAVTHRMPTALANRFVHLEVEPDLDDWVAWAENAGILPEVVAFLKFRPALLHDFDPARLTRSFPTPRSWSFVSSVLAAKPHHAVESEIVKGAVGEAAALEFSGYLAMWRGLPDPEQVLKDPDSAPAPEDPACAYAICEALGRRASVETMPALTRYAARLPVEFGVLLMRDAVRRDKAAAGTEAFASWARDNAEVFM